MEKEKANQTETPDGSQEQNVSSNPLSNQRGNFPIIIGGIFLLLLVAGGAYYLGTKNQQNSQYQATPSPTVDTQVSSAPTQSYPTLQPTSATAANWKTYNNQKLGVSMKYPQSLYLKEFESSAAFTFEPYPTGDGPGPLDVIEISLKGNYMATAFDALYKAGQGADVQEAQNAVDVKVEKLRNLKFGNYNAVEYIRDGLTPPKSGLGRGPIGYEHHVLIKKNDQEYIDLINQSMDVEKTKQRDTIFNEMVSSLSLK